MAPKRAAEEPPDGVEEQQKRTATSASLAQQQDIGPEYTIHDAADEEIDRSGMPTGWISCPKMGMPVYRFIPMKTPLGPAFDRHIPNPADRFTVQEACSTVNGILAGKTHTVWQIDNENNPVSVQVPATCGMVIDLTNSTRYYRIDTWTELGVRHVKIPNRGRGEVPAPQAVNDFVFEAVTYLQSNPAGYILVHCTHGFNRTGYMIVSYLMRMMITEIGTLEESLAEYARVRPPGIYKPYYVEHLFKYYHQKPTRSLPAVAVPDWKGDELLDEEEERQLDEETIPQGAIGRGLEHDDVLGEAISPSEASWVLMQLHQYLLGQWNGPKIFPGSQPVSLSRANMDMLNERRYWVTWKADGTRYLILIHRMGTYLVDRSNRVTRVQMRWPSPLGPLRPGEKPKSPVGPLLASAILDGEMVVDDLPKSEDKIRRFLIYDMMALNGNNMVHLPWWQRFMTIQKELVEPRRKEAEEIGRGRLRIGYDYNAELFRVRRKEFWPLMESRTLIEKFIPQISHEADGLILQPHDDPYIPQTYPELLKWKFAHMNSVDFKLRLEQGAKEGSATAADNGSTEQEFRPVLQVLKVGGGMARLADVDELYLVKNDEKKSDMPKKPRIPSNVEFAAEEDVRALDGHIIECAWDEAKHAWVYMRERRDKTIPNAQHVFEKVWASIQDNIKEEELLQFIERVSLGDKYVADRAEVEARRRAVPGAKPVHR